MFDQTFYATFLPDLVKAECAVQPGTVPVVELRLVDGTTLDVCHIPYLGPGWLAAACYPAQAPSAALTTEFVRYDLVTRITVSLQESQTRQLGFDLARNSAARSIEPLPSGGSDTRSRDEGTRNVAGATGRRTGPTPRTEGGH